MAGEGGGARVAGIAGQAAVEKVPGSSRPARSKRVGRAMQAPRSDADDGTGGHRCRPSRAATSIIHPHVKTKYYRYVETFIRSPRDLARRRRGYGLTAAADGPFGPLAPPPPVA